ncbi:hypothetical protein [Bacillus kexueae]|nr:hypothetical protein [Bacillus kexueae]
MEKDVKEMELHVKNERRKFQKEAIVVVTIILLFIGLNYYFMHQ